MLAHVRAFFAQREVLEVDTPILSHAAPIDTHIEVMSVRWARQEKAYLHTSPEYAMKRLLAQGIGDIYQLGHVFRAEEAGRLHNPEFTMIEWYRVGIPFQLLIDETLDMIRLFLGDIPALTYTYAEAFEKFVGMDYRKASPQDLQAIALAHHLSLPSDADTWDADTYLHFIMAFLIEPQLTGLHIIRDFPASQAALAQTCQKGGERIAERFEVYFNGVELANGFHELTDPVEQRKRLVQANLERKTLGKEILPIDERFIAALEHMPDSCGVAVGFDRLLMLQLGKGTLEEILPFCWSTI
ncbi:MAG: EF-P lysine aminoacylase GenX [Verrucomicrobia bacterium]|nr:EF-P lysine aminoacylase GenX [Verrucomicrobiota bacterium]